MIETPAEQTASQAPLPPLQRHQQLEVDTFCTGCGYNLHGQPVTRDVSLGIFVCRCPECGQFHPAGIGVTASSTWMSRLAAVMLTLWVLIIANAFFWGCIALGALSVMHVEMLTTTRMIAPDGREVEYAEIPSTTPTSGAAWTPVYKGTTQPAPEHRNVRTLDQPRGQDVRWRMRFLAFNIVLAAGTALVAGMLLVVFLWHWRRRRYAWVMLLPFLVAVGVAVLFYVDDWDDAYGELRGWIWSRAMAYAVLEAALLGVGILIGRRSARVVLRMFVPSRPRQYFAFLWHVDGKTPPPATPTAR